MSDSDQEEIFDQQNCQHFSTTLKTTRPQKIKQMRDQMVLLPQADLSQETKKEENENSLMRIIILLQVTSEPKGRPQTVNHHTTLAIRTLCEP